MKDSKPAIFLIISLTFLDEGCFSQNFSRFQDELVSKTVQEYTELCPFTDLCSINSTKTIPWHQRNLVCCDVCICEDGCRDKCCPDKPSKYLNDEEIYNIKHNPGKKCVWAQYKHVTMSSKVKHTAFDMVVTCPQGYNDQNINSKCRRSYHDFDFEEKLAYFAPASDGSDIFKNRYCAICNGVNDKDLSFMDIELSCTGKSYFPNFSSLSELKQAIDNEENCDLIFIPNRTLLYEYSMCRPLIDRCNVSGNWKEFDADVERACLSYTSLYYFMYKNVHCYLCNKGSEEEVVETCELPDPGYGFNAFTAQLDFRGLQKVQEHSKQQNTVCPQYHIYDASQDKCRSLLCPDLMFVEGRCTSFYTTKPYIVTDVYISLEPITDVQDLHLLFGSLDMLKEALWYHVKRYLDTKRSTFHACQLDGFMVLHRDYIDVLRKLANNTVKSIKYSDIKYIAIRISLGGMIGGETFEQDLQIVDDMFLDYKRIPELANYIIRYKSIPVEMFNQAEQSLVTYEAEGNSVVDQIATPLLLDGALHGAFGAAFSDVLYGLVICPIGLYALKVCNAQSEHLIQHFCPKLLLSTGEYQITNEGIQLLDIDGTIQNDKVLFTMNDSALVCYKLYMDLVDKYLAGSDTDKWTASETVTIVALGLSLASLFVTFMTYLLFKQLRTLPGLNIMGLTSSLFISHLLALTNTVIRFDSGKVCISFGIALHFFLLLSIFWMFVCTFHMAKVFVTLQTVSGSRTSKFYSFSRYIIFTIIMSTLFVAMNIIKTSLTSNGEGIGYNTARCFIESSDMVLVTSAVPIGIVVVSNIVMFICVIIKVSRSPDMKSCRTNDRNNIAIFAKLSTITGITYVFGFLYQFTEIQFFSYVFILFNGCQGVFILVAFILNRRVLGMFKEFTRDHLNHHSSDKHVLHNFKTKTDSDSHHADTHHTIDHTDQTSL